MQKPRDTLVEAAYEVGRQYEPPTVALLCWRAMQALRTNHGGDHPAVQAYYAACSRIFSTAFDDLQAARNDFLAALGDPPIDTFKVY